MKMHYYFHLNIKHRASQLYFGAQIQLWGPGVGAAEGGGEGRGLWDAPGGGGLQLSSAGTVNLPDDATTGNKVISNTNYLALNLKIRDGRWMDW